ncbi:TetR/AcrR family transcriptional regulator [Arthrobacter sp. NamB2]|uniref:TetR/AcrR family transcriptional regulator n=1 Tax=Arthrobacter sp. NamB2 TaxID=2576035 RepID=UPI0010CA1670|nr:TetR/AcrR family transcriptional regulator [Arthrobacter sp. NamB2]TKV27921.1 TetR/AcrR family transcriptional regulator [Arthrobacter sp. NamB2]
MGTKAQGTYAKGIERRRELLRIAAEVFIAEGFEGTTLKLVAERAGIKEATLFHYFSGKQDLLTAVLADRDEQTTAGHGGTTASLADLPDIAAHNERHPGLTALFAVASATATRQGHAARDYFRERYAWLIETTAKDISAAQSRGEIRSDISPEDAARIIIGVFDGIQLQWLYDPSVSMPAALTNVLRLLDARP